MSNSLIEKINIYITVDLQTINSYFNAHDPSPLYKKKINQKFEQYILSDVSSAKRYSAIFYILMARNKSPATPEEDDSVNAIFSPTPQTYEYPDPTAPSCSLSNRGSSTDAVEPPPSKRVKTRKASTAPPRSSPLPRMSPRRSLPM